MVHVEQRLEQIAVLRDGAERGAADACAMVAPLPGDEPRARALSGKLVIGERSLERGIDRFRARVAEGDAVEIAGRNSARREANTKAGACAVWNAGA
jgi:hypothetical protein